jgi:hypothetical protein
MKAAIAEIIRTHLLRLFFSLLTTFSTGSWVWAYSVAQNQDCASNCERIALPQSHQQIEVFAQIKTQAANPASFPPAEQVGALQPLESAVGVDVRVAGPRVTPSGADATEGGSTPGPRFFLIIGSVLIGVRLIISYRSRKLRKLAAETH